jgi:hypothetical protein
MAAAHRDRRGTLLGKADFYEEGAKLNNKAPIRDPYEARAISGDLEVERRERMET